MVPSLLELIAILLSVFMVVAVILWLDVAYRGPGALVQREKVARFWQPPLAHGRELFEWARDRAAGIVGRRLGAERSTSTPTKLAVDLHEGAMRAMLPFVSEHDRVMTMPCPRDGQGMIGITPPEAIALADYIHKNLSRSEAKRIHDLAAENAKNIAELNQRHHRGDEAPCALLSCESFCSTYAVRPLQCRPLHARMISRQLGLETGDADGRNPPAASCMQAIELGLEAGLIDELENASLDANHYELNGALVVALDTADAAERWLNGENIFADCQICH